MNIPRCRMVYFNYYPNFHRDSPYHKHDFWQLDTIARGIAHFEYKEPVITLEEGDTIIIPPKVSHRLRYPAGDVTSLSIKFIDNSSPAESVCRLKPSQNISAPVNALRGFLSGPRVLCEGEHEILGYLLEAVMCVYRRFMAGDDLLAENRLCDKVRAYIRRHTESRLTLKDIAEAFHISTSRLCSIYRHETGESVMSYARRQKVEAIKGRLADTDYRMKELADLFGFADAFTFSKFFKRSVGISPKEYRRRGTFMEKLPSTNSRHST